jgi:hemolysin activation/secretion protein
MPSRLRSGWGLLLAVGAVLPNPGWSAETPPAAAPANPPTPPQKHFNVLEYRVLGNTALPSTDLERLLYPLLGNDKTLTDIESAKAALEKLYHDRGFGTVYVDIPPQDVTEGIVRLKVTEGRVGRSQISGARYSSERDILIHLPAATSGTVLNIPALQQQLAAVNTASPDRSVVPVLKAGSAPGTVDVALQVHDELPLHASIELNNQQTVDTRPLRTVAALDYGDMFGRLDNLSVQYQTTPQQFNQVRVFAANYTVHDLIDGVQPSFFYIDSDSNVATVGTLGVLGKGQIGGVRLTYPFASDASVAQSLAFGLDYKHFRNTVNENATTALDTPISYVNLSLAYTGVWRSTERITTVSLSANGGPRGFVNNPIEFANDRYKGRSNYFYVRADVATTFILPKQFSLRLRAAGQGALEPIITNENYSIAGIDGVRGYLESEELGDSAIKGTVQFQSPAWNWHERQLGDVYIFFDEGRVEVIDPLAGERGHTTLRSYGAGLDILPGQKVYGTLTWAKALATASVTQAGESRVLFLLHAGF